jgi:hypothetical protein
MAILPPALLELGEFGHQYSRFGCALAWRCADSARPSAGDTETGISIMRMDRPILARSILAEGANRPDDRWAFARRLRRWGSCRTPGRVGSWADSRGASIDQGVSYANKIETER